MAQKYISVSVTDIEDHLIDLFADRFQVPPQDLSINTDVRTRFNFNDAAWAGLAETISDANWCKVIHVRIPQGAMDSARTVKEIAAIITSRLPQLIQADFAGSSIFSISTLRKPKPKPKRKRKRLEAQSKSDNAK